MSDEEHLDIDPCDKTAVKAASGKVAKKAADAKEKNFLDAIAQKAALDAANKEIADIQAGMNPDQKARLLAAQGVVDAAKDAANTKSAKQRAPKGAHQAKCDDALKMIETSIEYIKDKHKGELLELYLLGLFVKDMETDVLVDSAEQSEHDAFKHWLTDHKTSIGLKKVLRKSVTPAASPAVSKNVSRAASVALDISFEAAEEAGAGAD